MNLSASFHGVNAVQLLLTNMEYVGGFQFDNIQFVGKIYEGAKEMLLVDGVDNKEF